MDTRDNDRIKTDDEEARRRRAKRYFVALLVFGNALFIATMAWILFFMEKGGGK